MADLSETADELELIARHLRRAGDFDLVRELTAGMRRGAQAAPPLIRANLIPALPDNYAETLDADLDITVSVRTSDANPGVSVTAKARGINTSSPGPLIREGAPPSRRKKGRKLRRLDAGLLTHPVFGDREVWRTQQVRPGWFTGPCQDAAPKVRAELEKALHDVSEKAVSKGSL